LTGTLRTNIVSRRAVLRAGGAVFVSIGMPIDLDAVLAMDAALTADNAPPLAPEQLSSYIAVNADGSVRAYFGKMDMGQGLSIAIAQMVAEELDVSVGRVTVVMGDTATTLNQGGASGSTGIQLGGKQMRMAAAEARRVLVQIAAERYGVGPDQLSVSDGIVRVIGDDSKTVAYADLMGGRYFNVQLNWNKQIGNQLYAPGRAQAKPASAHRIVGQPIRRDDVAPKVFCQQDFCTDIKVPGMVHARVIRPTSAGSVPLAVDAGSVRDIPNVQIVRKEAFLAVVADSEWDAVKAMRQLSVTWSTASPPFPDQAALFDHIRNAPVRHHQAENKDPDSLGDPFHTAAHVIEAEYEWPFQSHASMGPACAVVEIKDGLVTCWTGSQKPHYVRDGIARILNLPVENVRVIWIPGPGSYGRNDADDCATDAAVIAQAIEKPVRLQYMREQATGWDPKGPASLHRARAAIDTGGSVIAYHFSSKGFSRIDVQTNGSMPADTLAGQSLGVPLAVNDGFGFPADSYGFNSKRLTWETIAPLLDRSSPLRSSHLRDPVGPQIHFASESFIDEVAAALGLDTLEFRLHYVQNPRDIAVIKAAAERSGWVRRPSPQRNQIGNTVTGRGLAYAQRNGTVVAVVAEVEIDRPTGRTSVRKFVVAHDCGQIINPDGLRKTIEGNIVQGISRALWEEVTFDNRNVTSVDWLTYPILDIIETPAIEIVLINRPELGPSGAGEPSIRPVAAAIANAIFDAAGVRIRRVPFTPERVKAALS
jgi:nicotinate dehydrogenase subunit B